MVNQKLSIMKNVAAAVIQNDGVVLITRRGPLENLAGYWEFPGGKQEANETIHQCLTRELKEELDLVVECTDVLTQSVYKYSGGAINLIAISTRVLSGNIKLTVHDQIQWVPVGELLNFKLAPADIPIARWLIDNL